MKIRQANSISSKVLALCLGLALLPAPVHTGSYTLNFKDAELSEFIKFVADATGYTVIIDPQVKAKIQVLSKQPLDEKELYDLFLSVLATHGYAAVKNGNVLRILPDKTARTTSVPVTTTGAHRDNAEFITEVIQLQNVSATKLIPVLRPLVPQEGHMAAYQDSNTIVISDTADNIKKITEIIASIDKGSNQEVEIIHTENASADELVKIMNQVLNPKAGDPASAEERVSLVSDPRGNNVIVSGTEQARMRVKVLIKQLDSPLKSIGNANVVTLEYASAKDLAPILSKVSQNLAKSSPDQSGKVNPANAGAMIEADEATNSLVITADEDVMGGVSAIIKQLDVPRAQVLVEAIIVEVIQGNGKDLGFDWLVANESGGFGGSNQSEGTVGKIALGAFDDDKGDAIKGVAAALAGVTGGVWGAADYNPDGTSFAAILNALETNADTNILSTPSLMTLDNNEASIVVGQEVPFVTGSYTSGTGYGATGAATGASAAGANSSYIGNPFQTINRKNVGITLKVTPHVNLDDKITLKIMQEVSGLAKSDVSTADVITNERKIETTVTTGNGEVVVLGGLIEDDVQESVSKVPILGDIPLIGRLFRKTSDSVRKKNLMVFLRPMVVRNSESSMEVSEQQYRKIRYNQNYQKAKGMDLFNDDVMPVLPEWDKQVETARKLQAEAESRRQAEKASSATVQPLQQEKVDVKTDAPAIQAPAAVVPATVVPAAETPAPAVGEPAKAP